MRVLTRQLVLLALCSAAALAQVDLEPDKPVHNPPLPTITFTYQLDGAEPSHYALSVESSGRAGYRSNGPESEAANLATPGHAVQGDPYVLRFTMSKPACDRLFELAKNLDYFKGKYDYTKTRVANMGAKTLIFADPDRHNETSYNWSQNGQIQEITKLIQAMSSTLEFNRQLQDDYRYRKLGVDADLKNLEQAQQDGNATELQIVAPMLEKIVNDKSLLHIARVRAQRLLDKVNGSGAAGAHP